MGGFGVACTDWIGTFGTTLSNAGSFKFACQPVDQPTTKAPTHTHTQTRPTDRPTDRPAWLVLRAGSGNDLGLLMRGLICSRFWKPLVSQRLIICRPVFCHAQQSFFDHFIVHLMQPDMSRAVQCIAYPRNRERTGSVHPTDCTKCFAGQAALPAQLVAEQLRNACQEAGWNLCGKQGWEGVCTREPHL